MGGVGDGHSDGCREHKWTLHLTAFANEELQTLVCVVCGSRKIMPLYTIPAAGVRPRS